MSKGTILCFADMTISQLFAKWAAMMAPVFKPSTRHFLKATIAVLERQFGGIALRDLSTDKLQTYIVNCQVCPKTMTNRMTVFRRVWNDARTWGLIQGDPFRGLVLPKLIEPEPRCFTLDEVTRILSVARDPYRTLFRLAAETGMRGGEICALAWREVDLEARTVRVVRSVYKGEFSSPKTRAGRRLISISNELATALRELKSRRDGVVFADNFGHMLNQEKVVQRQLRPILRRLGISGGGLHAFRHFNASIMDRESIPMKTRQMRLGHSSPQTTLQLYTHLINDSDERTASALARVLVRECPENQRPCHGLVRCWSRSTVVRGPFWHFSRRT